MQVLLLTARCQVVTDRIENVVENCGRSLCIAPATTADKETSPTIKKEIIKTPLFQLTCSHLNCIKLKYKEHSVLSSPFSVSET